MQVIHLSYPSVNQAGNEPVVLAIGYFDGVHIGHQKVIRTAQKMAQRLKLPLAVMTFHPHPKEVLQKKTDLRYLTPWEAKIDVFGQLGVEKTYLMKFDFNLARLSAEEFVEKILIPLQVKGIVTGFNFRFGKDQSGSTQDLHRLSQGRFETETVGAVVKKETNVSSTWIRQLLANGEIDLVTDLLGRYYRFQGVVEQGDQRGRLIGFPTANLALSSPFCLPKRGVYIVRGIFEHHADEYTTAYGLMNIGVRPTFKEASSHEKVEVHLFHPNVDLYGKELTVEVYHYLRSEQKFSSVDALVQQIETDKSRAEKWLSAAKLFT